MKIIRNRFIPFGKNYIAINICGILFVKGKRYISPIVINHERIHTVQMLEMFVVGFYLWYLIEYIIVRFFHRKQLSAYHDISFEEEAYNNDENLSYLLTRKPFQYKWFKYLKIRSK